MRAFVNGKQHSHTHTHTPGFCVLQVFCDRDGIVLRALCSVLCALCSVLCALCSVLCVSCARVRLHLCVVFCVVSCVLVLLLDLTALVVVGCSSSFLLFVLFMCFLLSLLFLFFRTEIFYPCDLSDHKQSTSCPSLVSLCVTVPCPCLRHSLFPCLCPSPLSMQSVFLFLSVSSSPRATIARTSAGASPDWDEEEFANSVVALKNLFGFLEITMSLA